MYDILIKGGMVVDPAQGIHALKDVATKDGHIAAVEDEISSADASRVVFASGKLVTAGLVDIHVHIYHGVSHFGTEPDACCLAKGVTTAVDAGSAGAQTFPGLRRFVLEKARTRLLAYLNISAMGMLVHEIGELEDIRYADTVRAIAVANENRGYVVGIKVRQAQQIVGDNGIEPLRRAREAADALGMRLMIHPGRTPAPLKEILTYLKKGDVHTHCFHGRPEGVLDEQGQVRPEVVEAAERGVIFDVGHGVGSFSFDVAERSMSQGLFPSTISTDIHAYDLDGPVFDLATTMSKFLYLGLSLDDVVRMSTVSAAAAAGLDGGIGTLKVGADADIGLFELVEGKFILEDCHKRTVTAERRLLPYMTLREGRIVARKGKLAET